MAANGLRAGTLGRRAALSGLFCISATLFAGSVTAGTSADLGYTRLQVYSGALRYLRIDLGYEITEKNAEAAYLLFKYQPQHQKQTSFGAFEIIETKTGVKLAVKLPKMPGYHEQVLRDGLIRKLREDYGESSPKAPPDESKKKPKKKRPSDDDEAPKAEEDPPQDGKSPVERLRGIAPEE